MKSVLVIGMGHKAAGKARPCRQERPQIQKAQHIAHHTPSRSKGGVYSSFALLFSCM